MARMGPQRADSQKRPRSAPRGAGGHTQRQCKQPRAALRTCLHPAGSGEHGGPGERRGGGSSQSLGWGDPAAKEQRELEGTLAPRGAPSPYPQGRAPSMVHPTGVTLSEGASPRVSLREAPQTGARGGPPEVLTQDTDMNFRSSGAPGWRSR